MIERGELATHSRSGLVANCLKREGVALNPAVCHY
jgi:hypothetical protein